MNRDELFEAYQNNPTLETYVKLRKSVCAFSKLESCAVSPFDIWITTGPDWVYTHWKDLEAMGIDPMWYAGAMDGDPEAISVVSVRLMELILERQQHKQEGKTHQIARGEAISDSLVNFLITSMLDRTNWAGTNVVPNDLIILIRHQLIGNQSEHEQRQKIAERRRQAIHLAWQLRTQGEPGSIRQVAKMMKLTPSTVSRWFADGTAFESEVTKWSLMLEGMEQHPEPTKAEASDPME